MQVGDIVTIGSERRYAYRVVAIIDTGFGTIVKYKAEDPTVRPQEITRELPAGKKPKKKKRK
ncbi:MAG: hypothetical protein WC333_02725 [Dehalococcoidia bacterium]|jgi:hypothetical protein